MEQVKEDGKTATPEVIGYPLFTVPVWRAAVQPGTDWIPKLVTDIETLLRTDPQDIMKSSGNQTYAELQTRKEDHWVAFFAWVRAVFEEITATAPVQRYRSYEIRSWALRVDTTSARKDNQYGPMRLLASHNHSPALLTSVFTCELPDKPEPEKLSTIFHNPVFHANCPWQPKTSPVAPEVGALTVFPGWLEHSVPVTAPIPEGQRRITINTDYFPHFR